MAATREMISKWFDDGVIQGETHMIIMCDEFDYENYPVYRAGEGVARDYVATYPRNMQRVEEVYNLQKDKEEQMAMERVFCY